MPSGVLGNAIARRAVASVSSNRACAPLAPPSALTPATTTARLVLARLGRRALFDLVNDRRIRESRRVAERSILRDVAQQPAHDLAAARLRQLRREDDIRRLGDRADLLGHVVAQPLEHLDGAVITALERHVGDDRLPRALVLAAADGRLGDSLVVDQRALDLD